MNVSMWAKAVNVIPRVSKEEWSGLDVISRFVPFRYLVDAVRAAFVGDYGSRQVGLGALVAVGLAVISVAVGTRFFRKAGA